MNRTEKAALVELLKQVKRNLQSDFDDRLKSRFICITLKSLAHTGADGQACGRYDLADLISERLAGYITLEGWLGHRGFIDFDSAFGRSTFGKMQATRQAWLDSLIAEFS